MTKIGTNSPCPCGSGRKYKTCCGAALPVSEVQFESYRMLHAKMALALMDFAEKSFGLELEESAWTIFACGEELKEFDPRGPIRQLFAPWFVFNFGLDLDETGSGEFSDITIAELFLAVNSETLTGDEKEFLISCILSPYTFCEVVDVRPGSGMTLLDLMRDIRFDVVEHSASRVIKEGEIMYCATSDFRGFVSNIATGDIPLRPTSKADILDLRKWIVGETGETEITAEDLLEFEIDIRWTYLSLAHARMAPPLFINNDGHRIVPQKLYFEITSADQAFHALKHLAKGDSEDDLLNDALVENNTITRAEIPWLSGTGKKSTFGTPTLLGLLKVRDKQLVIEVNSSERADKIRKIVERKLKAHVTYQRTLIEAIEPQVREAWEAAASSESGTSHETSGAPLREISPGEFEILDEISRKYWEVWFDEPLPALGNLTPSEAAETAEGRSLLESLFREYANFRSTPQDIFAPDVEELRKKLNM